MNTEDDLEIVGFDRTSTGVADMDRWTGLVAKTLRGESVPRGRLDVIFVDEDEMAELNKTHMGHEGPTDVLSFPLDGEAEQAEGAPDHGDDIFANLPNLEDPDLGSPDLGSPDLGSPDLEELELHLGDVVVCPSVAARQAGEHAGSFDAEMTLLIVHGTLHILGHDHAEPDETELMQGRERVHMEAAGFRHPRWAGQR